MSAILTVICDFDSSVFNVGRRDIIEKVRSFSIDNLRLCNLVLLRVALKRLKNVLI
jgi:hypothetical protein